MDKIKKLAFAAAISFAAASTFNCSSDGNDDDGSSSSAGGISSSAGAGEDSSSSAGGSSSSAGGTSSPSGNTTGEQVYLENGNTYSGNAVVVITIDDCDDDDGCKRDTLQAGNIQSGKITLKLPASINSKYLQEPLPADICELFSGADYDSSDEEVTITESSSCESTTNSLNGASIFSGYIKAFIPGKGLCELNLKLHKNNAYYRAEYMYTSKAGHVAASYESIDTYEYPDDADSYSSEYKYTFDWNFSAGWNTYYEKSTNIDGVNEQKSSTNISVLDGNALKWVLNDDDCDTF